MGILKRRMNKIVQDVDDMKVDFQDALEEKGIEEPGNSLPKYPEKILEIPTGGGGGGELPLNKNLIRFFDLGFNKIGEQIVEDGQAVTLPENPAAPAGLGLTFSGWGAAPGDLDAIYCDMDLVAQYDSDGTASLIFRVEVAAGSTLTLPVKSSSGDCYVKWTVDGAAETFPGGGAFPSHVYAADYSGYVIVKLANVSSIVFDNQYEHNEIQDVIMAEAIDNIASLLTILLKNSGLYICSNVVLSGANKLEMTNKVGTAFWRLNTGGITGNVRIDNGSLRTHLDVAAFPKVTGSVNLSYSVTYKGYIKNLYLPYASGCGYVICESFRAKNLSTINAIVRQKQHYVGNGFPSSLMAQDTSPIKLTVVLESAYSGADLGNVQITKVLHVIFTGQNPVYSVPVTGLNNIFSDFIVEIPEGEQLSLSGNLSLAGLNVMNWDQWAAFFGMLANGSYTITLGGYAYLAMPDSVKAIATGKGYSLTR